MKEKFGVLTKKIMLEELKEEFDSTKDFFITNYKGLTATEVDTLKKELRAVKAKYIVVKNSIARRVFDQLDLKDLEDCIKGEVGIGFSTNIVETSKAFVGFSKEHPALKLSCAFIEGKMQGTERIKQLATLPPREVLLAMALTQMKSPITGFVSVLNSLMRNFVYVINEIKSRKEGGDKQ